MARLTTNHATLSDAIAACDEADVLRHLSNHGTPNIRIDDGDGRYIRPAHWLARLGKVAALETLLGRLHADPNAPDDWGNPPLFEAIMAGQAGAVRVLIEHGADPNGRFTDGDSPLHLAIAQKHGAIAEILMNSGGNMKAANARGLTPLDIWAWEKTPAPSLV